MSGRYLESDYHRYVCVILAAQTELMRVQSQLEATKKESDLRNSGLNKKIQKIVENRGICACC